MPRGASFYAARSLILCRASPDFIFRFGNAGHKIVHRGTRNRVLALIVFHIARQETQAVWPGKARLTEVVLTFLQLYLKQKGSLPKVNS